MTASNVMNTYNFWNKSISRKSLKDWRPLGLQKRGGFDVQIIFAHLELSPTDQPKKIEMFLSENAMSGEDIKLA